VQAVLLGGVACFGKAAPVSGQIESKEEVGPKPES